MHINHPYILVFSVLIISGLFFSLPVFGFLDDKKTIRKNTFDPLRFFLASFVAIHHAFYIRDFILLGTWTGNTSTEIVYLAHIGVTVFFMLTGFLFWGWLKKNELDWINLYKDRLFRMAPLIIFNALFIAAIVFYITKETPNISFFNWFDLLNNKKPDYSSMSNTWALTAGVYWTLVYEWGFYFSLPLLSLFCKKSIETSISLVFLSVYAAVFFQTDIQFQFITMFFVGMLVSDISDRLDLPVRVCDFLIACSVAMIFIFEPAAYNANNYMNFLLGVVLFGLSKNATIFGFLTIKGFKRLGDASYSIYVMHASVIFIVLKLANKINPLQDGEYSIYASYVSFAFVFLVSVITFHFIERPMIRFGKKLTLGVVSPKSDGAEKSHLKSI